MKNPLIRYYGRNDLHFITFSCYQRKSLLSSIRAKNLFVKILGEVRERYQFRLVGGDAWEEEKKFAKAV